MERITRRRLLAGMAASPALAAVGSALRPAEAATENRLCRDWPFKEMARPTYSLDLRHTRLDLFGHTVDCLLPGGTWPGTPLSFKKGDMFRVQVNNALQVPTSIHWHGLLPTSLQDGVPNVSQLPIAPGMSQYYEFLLKQTGTYWYHSHYGLQEQVGMVGPLIIEDPDEPHSYDLDEVIFLSDVPAQPVDDIIPMIRGGKMTADFKHPYTRPGAQPFVTDVSYAGYLLNGHTNDAPWSLAVPVGSKLRLRIINGSGSSYFRVVIDGLPMQVIAADGEAIAPIAVGDLVIATAERYDVLVTVPESGSYTMHAAALGDNRQVVGVLHTKDTAPKVNRKRPRFEGKTLSVGDLRALQPTTLPEGDPVAFEVALTGAMEGYDWSMNGHTWPEPFAPKTAKPSYYDVLPGQLVRFALINKTAMSHPMHLHGHNFRVLGAKAHGLADAPIKDTISVSPNSTVWIEFYADNPGTWFWHCHNVWHLAVGMAQAVRYTVP
jgi:FtsP/CotA-like multicopper oxidase with cupredoxin domain